MLDEKYSRAAFDAAGLDTPEAARLAALLGDEILVEMHATLMARILEIVRRLNDMGHQLKPYGPLRLENCLFETIGAKKGLNPTGASSALL